MKLKIFITLLALTVASSSFPMSNNEQVVLPFKLQIAFAKLYLQTAAKRMQLEDLKTPESKRALEEFKNCFNNPEHVVTDQASKEFLKEFLQPNGTIYPGHAALMQAHPLPERTETKTAPATDHCNLM